MSSTEKILQALEAKGYPRETITVEWEPISYYSTGREGGWDISLDDEALELDPDWGSEVAPCLPGSKDVFELGMGSIMAYSLPVVLKIIKQLNPYEGLVGYYTRFDTLRPVKEFSQLCDGDNVLVVGRIEDRMQHVFRSIKLKKSRQDGEEVILDVKKNWFFNFERYTNGDSWVKQCYLLS